MIVTALTFALAANSRGMKCFRSPDESSSFCLYYVAYGDVAEALTNSAEQISAILGASSRGISNQRNPLSRLTIFLRRTE
jgi:hypothetical protein